MNKISINYKKLSKTAKTPTKGTEQSVGYDLYADLTQAITIAPQTAQMIQTNIAIELPPNYWAGVFARSGLATKKGGRPSNCVGVIDPDYRGGIGVSLYNDSSKDLIIEPNERIAQLVIMPAVYADFSETIELNETERKNGGFGSTGKF